MFNTRFMEDNLLYYTSQSVQSVMVKIDSINAPAQYIYIYIYLMT